MKEPNASIYPEDYPVRTLCLSLGHLVFSYGLGALIFLQLHLWFAAAYVVLCVAGLVACLKYRCRFCWYYGRTCYAGLGRIAKSLFGPGVPEEFLLPRNLIPAAIVSFAILLLPLIVILVTMLLRFDLFRLTLFFAYVLLVIAPGFPLRKTMFCSHCKQGELGCPAYEGMRGRHGTKSQPCLK